MGHKLEDRDSFIVNNKLFSNKYKLEIINKTKQSWLCAETLLRKKLAIEHKIAAFDMHCSSVINYYIRVSC